MMYDATLHVSRFDPIDKYTQNRLVNIPDPVVTAMRQTPGKGFRSHAGDYTNQSNAIIFQYQIRWVSFVGKKNVYHQHHLSAR